MTIELCCPLCRRRVDRRGQAYTCGPCRRSYPVVFGIPDFRVAPPASFDREADEEMADLLAEQEDRLKVNELVELYYRLSPEASEQVHARHLAHLAGEEEQARAALERMERSRPFGPGDAVLEVGCGLGQHVAVAAERADGAVGVDLSLAFLVLTRKRLGGRGQVAAGEAERLPFGDGVFAAVVAADVIEHLHDPRHSLEEMGRVLRPGGTLFLSTPNRFSLTREPHVGLWGVGWLPRRWANRYVAWRRGVRYDDVSLMSVFSLRRLLRGHFPGAASVEIPSLSARQTELFPAGKRALARVYMALRRAPGLRNIFYLCGPFFHVFAVKR